LFSVSVYVVIPTEPRDDFPAATRDLSSIAASSQSQRAANRAGERVKASDQLAVDSLPITIVAEGVPTARISREAPAPSFWFCFEFLTFVFAVQGIARRAA